MNDVHAAAYALAALELLPGEPSDLDAVLADPVLRAALLAGDCGADCGTLVGYLTASIDRGRVESWEKRLDRLLSDGAGQPVLAGDQGYPALLAGCWDRPPVLFLRGHFAPDRAALAIVGSRDTKRQTLEAARGVAAAAAYAGMSIVSGLAAGVDTAAHCGALDAGGHTLAVLGTGIRQVFPQHQLLNCRKF